MRTTGSLLLASLLILASSASAAPPDQMATLGGALYRDTNLSKNANQSCMTCHHPSAGFADPANRVKPTLLPVSEGSIPGLFGGRNAPTAAYAGFSPPFHYDADEELYIGGMFWDGRATGLTPTLGDPLAEQALGPFLNPVEMALANKAEVIEIVKTSDYADLFLKVFGTDAFADVDAAYDNVGRAIAAFERSSTITRFNSKFDKFWAEQGGDVSGFGVDADGNYVGLKPKFKSKHFTRQEAEGLALFNAANKGMCALCHLTTNHEMTDSAGQVVQVAPLFTDFTYDNLGIPRNPRIAELAGAQPIDYGLGAMVAQIKMANSALDPALGISTQPSGSTDNPYIEVVTSEAGKFKVPTLRNVERTAPFGHNGFFATLEEITRFYNTRDVPEAGWPEPEVALNVNTDELGDLGLSPEEEAAIVAFMRTLTD